MGLRNIFKPPKEMTPEESRQYLQDKGLVVRGGEEDDDNRHRRFKFNAFKQFTKDGASGVPQIAPRVKGEHPGYREFKGSSGDTGSGYGESRLGKESTPGSSGSYQPGSQSSYGAYDPYAPTGEESQRQEGGSAGLQTQVQKEPQTQHYDPYAPDETATMQTDFNQFPNSDVNRVALQQEQKQKEEEELDPEEEEIRRIKGRTKNVRGATVKSSGGIVRNLREADDTATNVMGTLGQQREKMYDMESNLNVMETQQMYLDGSVKRLQNYKKSMFVPTSNPFTRKAKQRRAEHKLLEQRQLDRERDNRLNNRLHSSQNAILSHMKGDQDTPVELENAEMRERADYDKRVKAASTYLTEDHDSDDEKMEVEYSRNMDEAMVYAKNLREKANVIADEISSQNKGLERMAQKVNKVDDKMAVTTNRLRGI